MKTQISKGLAVRLAAVFAVCFVVAIAYAAPVQASGGHGDPTAHFNWTDVGYKSKDIGGGSLEQGEESMSPPIVLMIVNFGLLLILLGWKAMPAVRRATRQRSEKISDALDDAARLRTEAKAKLDEYSERIKDAEREVDDLIKGIRADAEAEKKRIIENAEAQAAALKRDAETRIAAEIARARTALEREVVAAAIAAAETVLRSKTTSADQIKLVDGFVASIKDAAKAPAEKR